MFARFDPALARILDDLESLKAEPADGEPKRYPTPLIDSSDEVSPHRPVSQIVKKGTRPSRSVDAKTLIHIKRFEQGRQVASERAPLVTSSHASPSAPLTPSKLAESETFKKIIKDKLKANGEQPGIKRRRSRDDPAWVTPRTWAKTTERVKAAFWHRAISDQSGFAFVLNFGPEILDRASKAPVGAPQLLRKRITKALKDALGRDVDMWCCLDVTKEGRVHVHGGMVLSKNELGSAEQALRRAGGSWSRTRGAAHQVWFGGSECEFQAGALSVSRRDYLQDDWASYSVRNVELLEQQTGHSSVYASAMIKEIAKYNYQVVRSDMIRINRSLSVCIR